MAYTLKHGLLLGRGICHITAMLQLMCTVNKFKRIFYCCKVCQVKVDVHDQIAVFISRGTTYVWTPFSLHIPVMTWIYAQYSRHVCTWQILIMASLFWKMLLANTVTNKITKSQTSLHIQTSKNTQHLACCHWSEVIKHRVHHVTFYSVHYSI